MQRLTILTLNLILLMTTTGAPAVLHAQTELVPIIDNALIQWQEGAPEQTESDGYVLRFKGQTVERTVDLPAAPANQRDARRIILSVAVEPVADGADGRPNDRWTRMGRMVVVVPGEDGPTEVELLRFMTGYGSPGTFEQDVTTLAPFLHGRATIRAFLNTYSDAAGWRLSASLRYADAGMGQRRAVFAHPVLNGEHVTSVRDRLVGRVIIPPDVDRPRLRVISTGHSTDGVAGNEFESATHVLSIDGRTVAMWRPWTEAGGGLRSANPWAGRRTIDGRTLWASDYDRSGWHPGLVVEPTIIPLPELTPGPHTIQIRIRGIRAKGELPGADPQAHGYWVVSAVVVADEHWPESNQ